MPIAAGLAGGVSLNSFGLASRGFGWGMRSAVRSTAPLRAAAAAYASPRILGSARKTGNDVRDVYRRASSALRTAAGDWRQTRR